MKNVLLIVTLVLATTQLHAQLYVEGIQIDSTNSGNYMKIALAGIGSELVLDVDYGQPSKPLIGFTRLTDENKNAIKFRSIVGALNYLSLHGWELVEILQPTESEGRSFLLKRKM